MREGWRPRVELTIHFLCCLVAKPCSTSAISWPVALQALLSMGFPRQEYWSGLSSTSPGDLPYPGIEPMSPVSPALAGRFFTTVLPKNPFTIHGPPRNKQQVTALLTLELNIG